jgi:hypothetical protein
MQDFQTLFDERYRYAVEMDLASKKDIRSMIYKIVPMENRTERKTSVGAYGDIPEFKGTVEYDRPYEQFQVEATARTFASGTRITLETIEDDLSTILSGDWFKPMIRALRVTQNKHAAWLFNFADSTDTYWSTRSENLGIASNVHKTNTPNVSTAAGFDNLIVDTLAPLSYRAASIQFRQFRDDRGQLVDTAHDELWVPTDQAPRAFEIIKSRKYADDNRNAESPEYQSATIKELIHWNSTENWALSNKEARELNCEWMERKPVDYYSIKEFDSFQCKYAIRGRWTIRVDDWRPWLFAIVQ